MPTLEKNLKTQLDEWHRKIGQKRLVESIVSEWKESPGIWSIVDHRWHRTLNVLLSVLTVSAFALSLLWLLQEKKALSVNSLLNGMERALMPGDGVFTNSVLLLTG